MNRKRLATRYGGRRGTGDGRSCEQQHGGSRGGGAHGIQNAATRLSRNASGMSQPGLSSGRPFRGGLLRRGHSVRARIITHQSRSSSRRRALGRGPWSPACRWTGGRRRCGRRSAGRARAGTKGDSTTRIISPAFCPTSRPAGACRSPARPPTTSSALRRRSC